MAVCPRCAELCCDLAFGEVCWRCYPSKAPEVVGTKATALLGGASRLENLRRDFQMTALRAQYWGAMATTGAAADRDIRRGGFDGVPLSSEEKIRDALETMKSHMDRLFEIDSAIHDAENEK